MMKIKNQISRRQFLKRAFIYGPMGLVGYTVLIERSIVLSNTYRIPVRNLPEAFTGFRIVHLTDLHYGPLVPLTLIEDLVDRTNRLKPDIIVCTGDYVHERNATGQIDAVWPVLSRLTARSGVYSVLGNHDHWASTSRSVYWLKRTGQDLRHKTVALEREGQRLWLAGAGDLWEDFTGIDGLLQAVPGDACRIVLAHNPDTADIDRTSRVDLMISGHTHGGQIDIPFIGPPVLPVKNKNYSSGLKHTMRGEAVFISRGIGWTIYPVRFNCYPEIAILELVPARQNRNEESRTREAS